MPATTVPAFARQLGQPELQGFHVASLREGIRICHIAPGIYGIEQL